MAKNKGKDKKKRKKKQKKNKKPKGPQVLFSYDRTVGSGNRISLKNPADMYHVEERDDGTVLLTPTTDIE